MERCANTEALNQYLSDEDKKPDAYEFYEDKVKEVEDKFKELAEDDSLSVAMEYLAGQFVDEAFSNVPNLILGYKDNDYFLNLIRTKAEWLLDNE